MADEFASSARIEDAELDAFGMRGKQREVHALAVPGCTEREW
jgi:hypothetical protein